MKNFAEFLFELSIEKAFGFASDAHKGQIRKSSGDPYVVHPTAVSNFLRDIGIKDRNIIVAAYLHDTIEDTPATQNQLKNEFNADVAKLVKELSSSPKGIQMLGKPQYLAQKMIKMSNGALLIKLADRWHNLADMGSFPKDKALKYINQTYFILGELKSKRRLNKIQSKVIRHIEKRMQRLGFSEPIAEAKIVGKIDLPKQEDPKISKQELDKLEKILDNLFKSVNIDIEFTRHFLDRVNDKRNKEQITIPELRNIFQKTYNKYRRELVNLGADTQAVLNDIQTDINLPFVLVHDKKNNELDLVAKTVLRKKKFKTSNRKLKV